MSCGLIILDNSGRVLSLDANAKRFMRSGLSIVRGHIVAADPTGAASLCLALRSVFDSKKRNLHERSFLISRGKSRLPYILHTYSMAEAELGKNDARAALIIIDPEESRQLSSAVLGALLKLPPGEARVAAEIVNGRTPRDAAGSLGLTENSVRVILKRVYSKANVTRQAELVLLASRFSNCTPLP
jgi:DNA-binding CsgD family transcriptional regulator